MSKKKMAKDDAEFTITIGRVTRPMRRITEAEWEEWAARRKPARPTAPAKPVDPNTVYTVELVPVED